ncbi:hypothetical protein, conserved [Eimeria tenella]|uniref:Uncharacterized protein n=1 Tax=Eimeria tenella TaxID=5802 RepID=U6L6A1_EIMTE|nr:hypothetical protein, conserved [Eimeria tenella]CDJ43330.1 hypothetical protein, conserved [Eimeria tenella]|eukprot:XP_013234080.1 hypothetical protein, conserved [Eimeria tenella]
MWGNLTFHVLWANFLLINGQLFKSIGTFTVLFADNPLFSTALFLSYDYINEDYGKTETVVLPVSNQDVSETTAESWPEADSTAANTGQASKVPSTRPRAGVARTWTTGESLIATFAFLSLCLLAAHKKKRPALKEQKQWTQKEGQPFGTLEGGSSSAQEREGTSESPVSAHKAKEQSRVEIVRGLLPLAVRLALALDSQESQVLLDGARESVKKAEAAGASATKEAGREMHLDNAVQALRRLHQMSLQQAQALAKAGSKVPNFSLLDQDESGGVMTALLSDIIEGEAVFPFVVYLRSLQQSAINVCQKFDVAHKRLLMSARFANEADGELLLSAAAELEWLRSMGDRKAHILQRARKVEETAMSGIRIRLLSTVEEWMRTLHLTCTVLNVYVGLVPDTVEASPEEGGASAYNNSESIQLLMKKLECARELMGSIDREKQAVEASTSVESADASFGRVEKLHEKTLDLLEDCWELTKIMSPPRTELNSEDLALLTKATTETSAFAEIQISSTRANLSTVRGRCSSSLNSRGGELTVARQLNPPLKEQLLDDAVAIEESVAVHYEATQNAVKELRSKNCLADATVVLDEMEESLANLVKYNERSMTLVLQSNLQVFLEDEVESSFRAAEHVFSSGVTFPGPKIADLHKLRSLLNEARKEAGSASTFAEAVQTAAKVRSHAGAIDDMLKNHQRSLLKLH